MKPYRSFLFMPGNNERHLAKGPSTAADVLLPDLEDSVPSGEKSGARAALRAYLREAPRPIFVRVNAVASGETQLDLEAVVAKSLEGIFLPKVESPDESRQVADWLDEFERETGLPAGQVGIVAMLESALGVLRAYEIAVSTPRVASLCFAGAENGDLQRDLGCGWSLEGTELLYARSKVLLDARAARLAWPLDGAYADLADAEGLEADTRLSKRLGYKGRTVVHPSQIEPVNRIYTPTGEQLDYWHRLLEAWQLAVTEDRGAVLFEGKMVDSAMAALAQSGIELAAAIEGQAAGRELER